MKKMLHINPISPPRVTSCGVAGCDERTNAFFLDIGMKAEVLGDQMSLKLSRESESYRHPKLQL